MTRKSMFRRVFDAIIEGRSRQAQRVVEQYLKSRGSDRPAREP